MREFVKKRNQLKHWWLGKSDRPTKEMYKVLRKKNLKDKVLLLLKEGQRVETKDENLKFIVDHFRSLIGKPIQESEPKYLAS